MEEQNELILNSITIKGTPYGIQDIRVDSVIQDVETNQSEINEVKGNVNTITAKTDSLQSSVEDLNQDTEDLQTIINNYKEEVATVVESLNDKIETNKSELNNEISNIAENVETLTSSKQNLLSAGENITIENDTISSRDTTYSLATANSDGLISKEDKSKLDNLELAGDGKLTLNVYGTDNSFTANQSDNTTIVIPSEIDDSQIGVQNTWSAAKIKNLITNFNSIRLEIVEELPISDIRTDTIYLIPTDVEDIKNEYIYIDEEWFLIGNTKINLTDYYTKAETYSDFQIDSMLAQIKSEIIQNIKNGKLTLKLDNTIIGTFTANQSDDKVVQIPNIASDWYDIDEENGSGEISTNPQDILYDSDLSLDSINAVQNKVITAELQNYINEGSYNSDTKSLDFSNNDTIITSIPIADLFIKTCDINSITNLKELVSQYSIAENDILVCTNLDDTKVYQYELNGTTKNFKGDGEHDLIFRYIGNNEFKPIVFGIM